RVVKSAPLPHAMYVGPRPRTSPESLSGFERSSRSGGPDVQSLRPFAPGDPQRLVHWPSTARTGELIIKELAQPKEEVTVVVDPRLSRWTWSVPVAAVLAAIAIQSRPKIATICLVVDLCLAVLAARHVHHLLFFTALALAGAASARLLAAPELAVVWGLTALAL